MTHLEEIKKRIEEVSVPERGMYLNYDEIVKELSAMQKLARTDAPWLIERLEAARQIIDSYSQEECKYEAKEFLQSLTPKPKDE